MAATIGRLVRPILSASLHFYPTEPRSFPLHSLSPHLPFHPLQPCPLPVPMIIPMIVPPPIAPPVPSVLPPHAANEAEEGVEDADPPP